MMRLLAAAAASAALAGIAAPPAGDAASVEAGMRIYREGILPSGAPLRATGQNGTQSSGRDAACINCHRRSGYGSSEGQNVIRPLPPQFRELDAEASTLRARPVGGGRVRPFYGAESLGKALRHGEAAGGQPLSALMPRYELDEKALSALAQYLRSMSASPAPGVSSTALRFATVVTPDADPASARAMLAVLGAFVADKNGATRSEQRRRAAGSDWMYQGYRTWELDVWQLSGPPATWGAQLEERYRERPPFALISGIAGDTWQPVHDFCERVEMPCILPNASGLSAARDFYSIYYSRGIAFGGELLAGHLHAMAPARVIQVYRASSPGSEAAAALRAARSGASLLDVPVEGSSEIRDALSAAVARETGPYSLVLWLGKEDLDSLRGREELVRADGIFVSGYLVDPATLELDSAIAPKVRVVYPYDLPQGREQRLARARLWMKAKKIEVSDERVQANTFFAASLASDAIGHIAGTYSREYLIERMEHMAGRLPNTSYYPRISIAPGQRYASKGGYIVRLSGDPAHPVVADSPWIVP